MHDDCGMFIPDRSAANAASKAAGMTMDDGQLALSGELVALDETEVVGDDPRVAALLANLGL